MDRFLRSNPKEDLLLEVKPPVKPIISPAIGTVGRGCDVEVNGWSPSQSVHAAGPQPSANKSELSTRASVG
jgi:hypothetical protein